jgi:hypothetical protein
MTSCHSCNSFNWWLISQKACPGGCLIVIGISQRSDCFGGAATASLPYGSYDTATPGRLACLVVRSSIHRQALERSALLSVHSSSAHFEPPAVWPPRLAATAARRIQHARADGTIDHRIARVTPGTAAHDMFEQRLLAPGHGLESVELLWHTP